MGLVSVVGAGREQADMPSGSTAAAASTTTRVSRTVIPFREAPWRSHLANPPSAGQAAGASHILPLVIVGKVCVNAAAQAASPLRHSRWSKPYRGYRVSG